MEKILKLIGIFALAFAAFYARVYLLCKIWDCTGVKLGAPHFTWMQMFMLVWFLDCAIHRTNDNSKEGWEGKFIARMASGLVSLLFGWGLAYWMFC